MLRTTPLPSLRSAFVTIVGLVGLLGVTGSGLAQDSPPDVGMNRTVGDFRFIPSNLVPDPFATTHFSNSLGIGLAMDVELPVVIIEGDTLVSLNGNLAFVIVGFEYQFAPTRDLAFRIGANVVARVGTGAEAILSQGVSAVNSIQAGTTIKLYRDDKFLLSGTVDAGSGSSLRVDIVQFAEDLIEFGPKGASLVQENDGLILRTGLRAAYAPSRWWGITAVAEFGYLNSVRDDDTGYKAGILASLDWGQKGGTPIALQFGFSVDAFSLSVLEDGTTVGGLLGIMYTGREDFSLGLEIGLRRIPLEETQIKANRSSYTLFSRYYF